MPRLETRSALIRYLANQGRLESGDPDMIFPGEEIILPPVD